MNTLAARAILFFAMLNGATSSAQVAWTLIANTGPSGRVKHRMVFDTARGVVVLFGGGPSSGCCGTDETWEWGGTAWLQRSPSVRPPARFGHGMAYDSRRGRVVVFGGDGTQGSLGDTWEYDGTTWQQRTLPAAPSPRSSFAMTFDSARGVVVLHGGGGGNANFETWEYDGQNWAQRFPSTRPDRNEHSIAFDAWRGRVVLFGGRDGRDRLFPETWEWDGNDWLLRQTTTNPPPRTHYSLAYDAPRRRIVLFGGWGGNALGTIGDTWEWDGASWLQRSPSLSPTPREQHALVWDSVREGVLMFGGRATGLVGETWRYAPTNPAGHTALGTGCAGSAGTPTLAPTPGSLPWIGDSFTMQVRNLPATAPVVYLFGNSNTAWGSLTLPADLTPLGMSGCFLRAAGIVTLPMLNQAGTASITFAIPTVRYLVRAPFYDQAFALDQQANPFGATLSNAGELRFGER